MDPYFCHPCFCHQIFTPITFAPEPPELAQRQQTFITEFAKDGRNTHGTFSQWDQPADPARGLKQAIEAIKFEISVLAGKPTNLPTPPSAPCSKAAMSSSPNFVSAEHPICIFLGAIHEARMRWETPRFGAYV